MSEPEGRPTFVEWLATKSSEPIVRNVKRYVCPYCRAGRSKPAAAVAHIARCWRNPDLRGCKTCRFLDYDASEPDVGYEGIGECCGKDVADLSQGLRLRCASWEARS